MAVVRSVPIGREEMRACRTIGAATFTTVACRPQARAVSMNTVRSPQDCPITDIPPSWGPREFSTVPENPRGFGVDEIPSYVLLYCDSAKLPTSSCRRELGRCGSPIPVQGETPADSS